MNTTHTFHSAAIPETYDLCVAGGGLAGVMSAVSAAREGLRVILVEKYGFLGGMATCGLVHPFMSWVEKGSHARANAGLFETLQRRVYELGGSDNPQAGWYMEEFMKLALDRMVTEAGVRVLFHAKLDDVSYQNGEVHAITAATVSGNIEIRAKYYIDGTGNGDLFAFAGLPYKLGREEDGLCQPMTLNFRLSNVDWDRLDWQKMQSLYKAKRESGEIRNPREDVLIFKMPVKNIMHLNTTRIVGKNPVDAFDYSASEMEAREQVYEMYHFMKDNIPGMENCALIMSAPELGIRESRRVIGEYEISTDDIVQARKFDDRIARGTYEIDIHNPAGSGTYHCGIPDNDYYTIPYRAIIPKGAKNLLVAGRPISSTHEAHSSFRIMPITTCIGEAAGAAVAQAVRRDAAVGDIDITELQNVLTDHGALV